MPVQINELVIRANIVEAGSGEKETKAAAPTPNNEEVVKECVAKVMEILTLQMER